MASAKKRAQQQNEQDKNYGRFSITLPPSKAQFIRQYAAEHGLSLSSAFDQLIHCDVADASAEASAESVSLHTLEHQQSRHSSETQPQLSTQLSHKGKTIRHSVNLSRPVTEQVQAISASKGVSSSEVVRQSVYRDMKIRELAMQGWKVVVQNPQDGQLMDVTANYILQS